MESKENDNGSKQNFGYIEIEWEIENYFPATCEKTRVIYSPAFTITGYRLSKWRFFLKAAKESYTDSDYVTSIYLERLEDDTLPCELWVNWSLWYSYGSERKMICEKECVFERNGAVPAQIKDLKSPERWLQLTSSDRVLIAGLILVRSTRDVSVLKRSEDLGLKSLSQDLGVLYKLHDHNDLTIPMGEKSLLCHKAVLCVRSETLEDYIEKYGENGGAHLDWEHYDSAVKVFSYLYSGNLDYILRTPSIYIDKCLEYLKIKKFGAGYLREKLTLKTKFEVREINVKCSIPDAKSIKENSVSSRFYSTGSLNAKFWLRLYLHGNGDKLGILLEFVEGSQPKEMYIEFDIIDKFGYSFNKKTMRWAAKEGGKLGIEDFVSREILNKTFQTSDGCLADFIETPCLSCTLHIPTGSSYSSVGNSQTCLLRNIEHEDHYTLFSTQITSLLTSGKHSDLTLICDNKTFKVHKCILSARSHTFKKLFEEMGKKDILTIPDFESKFLQIILGYIYSGTLRDYELCDALKIYDAAERFLILTLRNECSSILQHNLHLFNVLEVLLLASGFKDHKLKASAFKFIIHNFRDIQKQDNWGKLTQNQLLYKELKGYVKNYMECNPVEALRFISFRNEAFYGLTYIDYSMEY